MESKLVNRSELAQILGVSKPYITKLVSQGVLVFGEDKKIELSLAKQAIANSSNPAKAHKKKKNVYIQNTPPDNPPDNPIVPPLSGDEEKDLLKMSNEDFIKYIQNLSFNDSKTKQAQIDLMMKKINMDKELNNLVSIENVRKNAFELATKLKESLMVIPDRICDIVASETDARVIHNILTKELKQSLQEIIEDLSKK